MNRATTDVDALDWRRIATQLDQEGYAVLDGLLNPADAAAMARLHDTAFATEHDAPVSRCGIDLAPPWPGVVMDMCSALHPHLVQIADRWNEVLEIPRRHAGTPGPATTLALSRLREGDYQCLHQREEGEQLFPLQLVALLSEPGVDFTGGEFVMVEQRPRMQSRPMVVPLKRGDVAIIPTARRPVKGSAGHYRANMKQAISRVCGGERIGLECHYRDAAGSRSQA